MKFLISVQLLIILLIQFSNGEKRVKTLMAFPRIGRGGTSTWNLDDDNTSKRDNSDTGMWFGPRLGRVSKRDSLLQKNPWAYILLGESSLSRNGPFIPRLGRESEEIFENSPNSNGPIPY